MTKTILFLITILPAFLFGQPIKKIIDSKNHEVYYVLKSDKSVRQGNYKKHDYKGSTVINGHYNNGVKDSIWEFYNYKGELQQKFDFTKNELVFYKVDETNRDQKFKVVKGSDTIELKLDRPPIYIGADIVMFEKLVKIIQYPQAATEYGISGKVYISFMVDKNGKTSNHSILKGLGYGCDEEALRVVKEIPDNWLPGILNGQPVEVVYIMPIIFALQG